MDSLGLHVNMVFDTINLINIFDINLFLLTMKGVIISYLIGIGTAKNIECSV